MRELVLIVKGFVLAMKSPWSSRQCVGLLDEKPGFKPQVKYEKYFFGDFLSADFWQKL